MATATATVRRRAVEGASSRAASRGVRTVCVVTRSLSAAVLVWWMPGVWAQYGATEAGIPGVEPAPPIRRASESALRPTGKREWEIRPTLAIEETYTDNVRLRPRGAEASDWVTQIRPGVSIVRNGPRARLDLSYVPQLVYRLNEETKDIYHYLNAVGDAEIVPQLLFVDVAAMITQQNVSLLGPQAQSNINNTGNRTSVSSYSVSPYLLHDFGHSAQGEARFTSNAVRYGGGNNLFDSEANRVDMRLVSGPAFKLLTWKAGYYKERIEYTHTNQTIDLEKIFAEGRRLITANTALLGAAGYETNDYGTTGPTPRGALWSIGPEWRPTPRTRLAATAGHRYFGATHSLDFSHRTRLTTWRLSYDEDATTTRGQFLVPATASTANYLDTLFISRIPDPVARQAAVQTVMTQNGLPQNLTIPLNFVTTVPFLQKRWLGSFGIQGARNTMLANVFRQEREVLAAAQAGAGDLAVNPNVKQTGGSVVWSFRITPQTTSNVTAAYTRSQFPGLDRQDNLKIAQLTVTSRVQPRTTVSFSLRRLQNDSNQSAGSYKENAISVALLMRF